MSRCGIRAAACLHAARTARVIVMANDPIVEELHKIREELLEEYGGLDGYFEHLLEGQELKKDRIASREPREPIDPRLAPRAADSPRLLAASRSRSRLASWRGRLPLSLSIRAAKRGRCAPSLRRLRPLGSPTRRRRVRAAPRSVRAPRRAHCASRM